MFGKIVIENLIEIKKRRLGHLRVNAFASLFSELSGITDWANNDWRK